MLRSSLFCLPVLLSLACSPPAPGAITPTGYQSNNYSLSVENDPSSSALLPPEWKLDNYYMATARGGSKKAALQPKDGEEYKTSFDFDLDGDGKSDHDEEEYVYELRFTHRNHDGTIFLRTLPLSVDQGAKHLDVLLSNYAEASTGAGYEVVKLNENTSVLVEKRYAVTVSGRSKAELAGREALVARLDVANLDQLKLDPHARKEQVELVLAHTAYVYEIKNARQESPSHFPVLLLVGYANQPEHFEEGLKDFRNFLGRLKLGQSAGFKVFQEAQLEGAPQQSNAATPIPDSKPETPKQEAVPAPPQTTEQEEASTPSKEAPVLPQADAE